MPKIVMTGKQNTGGEWKPLPSGDYDVQIDKVESGTSKSSGAPQLILTGHVTDGPQATKSVTIFYSQKENSIWKIQSLLDAAEVNYEAAELEDKDEKGNHKIELEFDTDDLVGCTVRYTVSTRDYQGKQQNDFNKERSPKGTPAASKAPAGRTAPAAAAGAAPAQQQQQAAAPAQAAAAAAAPGTATRQRRTVTQ